MSRNSVLALLVSIAVSAIFLLDGTYSRGVPDELVADAAAQDLLGYGFWFLWLPFSFAQIIVLFLLARNLSGNLKSIVLSFCISVFLAASLYSYAGYETLKERVTQR